MKPRARDATLIGVSFTLGALSMLLVFVLMVMFYGR